MATTVQRTYEFDRIRSLPARPQSNPIEDAQLVEMLTRALRRPGGTQTLRPVQARALYEIWAYRGLLGCIGVGQGKTLISLLAPVMLQSMRPMLGLPAALIGKTERDIRQLQINWKLPNHLRLFSYETLSHRNHAKMLETYLPDLIVVDECQALRSSKSACTKRVARYLEAHPECRIVALSGTMTTHSIRDYWPLSRWALGSQGMPLPGHFGELLLWSNALDNKPMGGEQSRALPGPLTELCDDPSRAEYDLDYLRAGYGRRLLSTPGVVAGHLGADVVGTSLRIRPLYRAQAEAIETTQAEVRSTWVRPDGVILQDAARMRAVCTELALGFYYVWDPAPPSAWMQARQNWHYLCRQILSENRRQIDAESQAVEAVKAGHYPVVTPYLKAWQEIEPSFVPNSVPVWISDDVLHACAAWLRQPPAGVLWTTHVAFARELSKRTGVLYYGQEGRTEDGRHSVLDHPPEQPFIASTAAVSKGFNLQAWSRCLFTKFPSNSTGAEQAIGRLHRPGSPHDCVNVEILVSCEEHVIAWNKAVSGAEYTRSTTGQEQKILYADCTMPSLEDNWRKELL